MLSSGMDRSPCIAPSRNGEGPTSGIVNQEQPIGRSCGLSTHVLLCALAYYVEWHMRAALAPILFDDDDKTGA